MLKNLYVFGQIILALFVILISILGSIYFGYIYPNEWHEISLLTAFYFIYGLGSISYDPLKKGKIFNKIKTEMKFCNSCGNKFNFKKINECPNCNYNLREVLGIKYMNKFYIIYLIIFGISISLFILLHLIYNLPFWIFLFINYLILSIMLIYIFEFIKNHHNLLKNNLDYLRKILNYCINCGYPLNKESEYICGNCGFIFPIKKLKNLYGK